MIHFRTRQVSPPREALYYKLSLSIRLAFQYVPIFTYFTHILYYITENHIAKKNLVKICHD